MPYRAELVLSHASGKSLRCSGNKMKYNEAAAETETTSSFRIVLVELREEKEEIKASETTDNVKICLINK